MSTGETIKAYRKERKLTQKKLGELCGIAESTIRQYELGMRNPKIEAIKKIAIALEIPYTELLKAEGTPPTDKSHKNISGRDRKIRELFQKLNEDGQDKAIENVKLLTQVPQYKSIISSTVGDRIKTLRKFRNLTQKELATSLSISDTMLQKYEKGEYVPTNRMLSQISDILHVSQSALFSDYQDLSGDDFKENFDFFEEKVSYPFKLHWDEHNADAFLYKGGEFYFTITSDVLNYFWERYHEGEPELEEDMTEEEADQWYVEGLFDEILEDKKRRFPERFQKTEQK